MSKFISSKSEFLETLSKYNETHYGLTPDKIHALSTSGYQTFAASELYEMVSYSAYISGREMFPATARFKDSLLKWNKIADTTINNAVASSRFFYLKIDMDDILAEAKMINDKLYAYTIKAETEIKIDKFTYSLDYDLEIRIFDPEGLRSVTAGYVMDSIYNPISKVINPNVKIIKQNKDITLALELYQYKRVNKSFRYIDSSTDIIDIPYTNQLIDFTPYYRETEYKEYPIRLRKSMYYDRLIPEEPTIYYSLKDGKIVLTNRGYRGNFRPAKDSLIEVCIYETYGSEGNFEYISNKITIENEDDPIPFIIQVSCEKDFIFPGVNEDGIDEIRKKTLNSLHSRDSLISEHDLNVHFSKDNKNYKVVKTRDDMMYRVYSIYAPLKYGDKLIPTNTIDLKLNIDNCIAKDGYYKIPEDASIYSSSSTVAEMTNTPSTFKYLTSMVCCINKSARITETYEKYIDRTIPTEYEYIYNKTRYTFMLNRATIYREPNGKIKIKFVIMTNLATEVIAFHKYDEEGNLVDLNKLVLDIALERTAGTFLGHIRAKMVNYDKDGDAYEFEAEITTDYFIRKSMIDLELINELGNTVTVETPLALSSIKIIARDDVENTDKLSTYFGIPVMEGKGIVNVFSMDDAELVKNYTDISGIHMKDITNKEIILKSMPLFGFDFVKNAGYSVFKSIYDEMDYINSLYTLTQANFVTNVRFVNTYGVSRLHIIGNGIDKLDRTNISMKFRIGLVYNPSVDLPYVKNYIVNYFSAIDFLNDETFHISDLIHSIKQDIPDISKIEFVAINNYSSDYQYIRSDYNKDDPSIIPEIVSFDMDTTTLEHKVELTKI